jgi:hypothetical protein
MARRTVIHDFLRTISVSFPASGLAHDEAYSTRRSHHAWRSGSSGRSGDGVTRETFLKAMEAEGITVMSGYAFPIYRTCLHEAANFPWATIRLRRHEPAGRGTGGRGGVPHSPNTFCSPTRRMSSISFGRWKSCGRTGRNGVTKRLACGNTSHGTENETAAGKCPVAVLLTITENLCLLTISSSTPPQARHRRIIRYILPRVPMS